MSVIKLLLFRFWLLVAILKIQDTNNPACTCIAFNKLLDFKMTIPVFQSLLDTLLSKKVLILTLKPAFSQIEITPYTFFMSTRPVVFNKIFYNFSYYLHLNLFLFKFFLNKFFIKYFISFERSCYMINFFIFKLYNPFSQLRFFLFKKHYLNIITKTWARI